MWLGVRANLRNINRLRNHLRGSVYSAPYVELYSHFS